MIKCKEVEGGGAEKTRRTCYTSTSLRETGIVVRLKGVDHWTGNRGNYPEKGRKIVAQEARGSSGSHRKPSRLGVSHLVIGQRLT